jgi:ribonuclease III
VNYKEIEGVIHYHFRQVKLLEMALTHSSYANEVERPEDNNERLEFLGDAVLELCVSEELFRLFPDSREGKLTRLRARLVSKPSLAALAREIGLAPYLLLGKGEEGQGGRDRNSLLSDAVEAILGAIFLDGGYKASKEWVCEVLGERLGVDPEVSCSKDYKSNLQEFTQKQHRARPVYTLVSSTGPEHAKRFEVCLTLPDGQTVSAIGPSVKRAEQRAAGMALALLEGNGED